jgi:hypothetical protein
MTEYQFKAHAEKVFLHANPGAKIEDWLHCSKVTWANGRKGMSGVFKASGPGYRPREVVAGQDPCGFWVR